MCQPKSARRDCLGYGWLPAEKLDGYPACLCIVPFLPGPFCRVASKASYLTVRDACLAAFGPWNDVVGLPGIPFALHASALQLDLAVAAVTPEDREALFARKEALIILELNIGNGFEKLAK